MLKCEKRENVNKGTPSMQALLNAGSWSSTSNSWQKLGSSACLAGLLAISFPLATLAQAASPKPMPSPTKVTSTGYTGPNRSGLTLAGDSLDPVNSVDVLKQTLLRVYGAYGQLRNENEALKGSIAKLQAAVQQTGTLQNELQSSISNDLQRLKSSLSEKEIALQQSQAKIEALQAQQAKLSSQQTTQTATGQQLAALQQAMKAESLKRSQAETQQAALQQELIMLKASLEERNGRLQVDKTQQATALQQMKQQLAGLLAEKQSQQQGMEALKLKLQQTQSTLSELETLKAQMPAPDKLQGLESQNKTLANQVNVLQKQVAEGRSAADSLTALQAQHKELETQLQSAVQDKATLFEQVQTLKKQNATYLAQQAKLVESKASIGADKEAKLALEASLAKATETLNLKQQQLDDSQSKAEALRQQIQTLKASITSGAPDYQGMLNRMKEARVGLADAVQTINTQNQRISALNLKVEELQGQLIQTSQQQSQHLETVSLKEQASSNSEAFQRLTGDYQKLKLQADAANKELAELRSQHGVSHASSTDTQEKLRDYEALKAQVVSLNLALKASSSSSTTKNEGKSERKAAYELLASAIGAEAQGQYQQALNMVLEAQKQGGTTPPFVMLQAKLLNRLDKFSDVPALLEPLVLSYPGVYPEAYALLARAYLQQQEYNKAEKAYIAAMPLDLLSNYATLLKRTNRLEPAELLLKTALTVKTDDAVLYYNLGNLYSSAQRWDDAKQAYERALTLNTGMHKALYNLALVEVNRNDNITARRLLERFLQADPKADNAQAVRDYLKNLPAS
jgi:chromosome segregation ATPase